MGYNHNPCSDESHRACLKGMKMFNPIKRFKCFWRGKGHNYGLFADAIVDNDDYPYNYKAKCTMCGKPRPPIVGLDFAPKKHQTIAYVVEVDIKTTFTSNQVSKRTCKQIAEYLEKE